jgi:Ca2+-binding RTX toxin-like protein
MEVQMKSKRLRYSRLVPALVAAGVAALALPAAAAAVATVGVKNGTLTASGEVEYDRMVFSDENDPSCPGGPPCYQLDYYGGSVAAAAPCVITIPGSWHPTVQCPAAGIKRIRAVGREGEDTLMVSEFAFGLAVPTLLDGGGDDDQLTGSDRRDRLLGGEGNDRLDGRRAGDELYGQIGADWIDGARGHDRLIGSFGPDVLIGGTQGDLLRGAGGKDRLDGQQGRDDCYGGPQRDRARNCEFRRLIP